MTQEELDALMSGDIDDLDDEVSLDNIEDESNDEDTFEEDEVQKEFDISKKSQDEEITLPLPATNENKMVHQLDDVTKESEEKATEIFDIIDGVSSDMMDAEESLQSVLETIESNVELFTTLSQKFPNVEAFKTQLNLNQEVVEKLNNLIEVTQSSGDSIMSVMDIMQYQDIHRQKIERVINVMRALSKYMNSLFDSKVDDESRVSSAQHIAGDTHNELASTEDIEALLAQFGN